MLSLWGTERSLISTDQVSCGVGRKKKMSLGQIGNRLFTKGPGWFRSARLGSYEYCIAFQMAMETF
jgi:hypothetical protein